MKYHSIVLRYGSYSLYRYHMGPFCLEIHDFTRSFFVLWINFLYFFSFLWAFFFFPLYSTGNNISSLFYVLYFIMTVLLIAPTGAWTWNSFYLSLQLSEMQLLHFLVYSVHLLQKHPPGNDTYCLWWCCIKMPAGHG